MRRFVLFPLLISFLSGGCAGGPSATPTVAQSLDGPPLAIEGEYAGTALQGSMERGVMVGYGNIILRGEKGGAEFLCKTRVDSPPTENARVRGVVRCTGDRLLAFSLRNLGPDQGVGVAKEPDADEMMLFFYHPSREEAARRFPGVKADIERARGHVQAP